LVLSPTISGESDQNAENDYTELGYSSGDPANSSTRR
jgi:hypothetical protein